MLLIQILILAYSIYPIFGYPADAPIHGYRKLTQEQIKRLDEWTEDSKQFKWELSGQFEGDMILQPEQRQGHLDPKYRWPDKTIRYWIADGFTDAQKDYIVKSFQIITLYTCLKVQPADWNQIAGSLVIRPAEKGCSASVGFLGKDCFGFMDLQPDPIGTGCMWVGTILHELVHTIGFHHMQTDPNRDDYVYIMEDNIKDLEKHNFEKLSAENWTSFHQPYDYGSLMHYGGYAFAKDESKPTIIAKDPYVHIGQKFGLSYLDIVKIKMMYNCY